MPTATFLSRAGSRGGRSIAVAIAAGLALLLTPAPASAHPDHITTSPKDGSQLSSAPAAVVVQFSQKVTMARQGARLVDQDGGVVPSTAVFSNKNKTLTITPKQRLGRGRYAAAYNVVSVEGHFVPGAIAFTVAVPTQKGSAIKPKSMPNVPITVDGDRPGVRTITVQTTLKSADVTWRSAAVPEPMIWRMKGNGRTASGTGVLPLTGNWTYEIDLSTADTVMIPKGQVTLR